jgi:hypothetical protein
MVMTYTKPTVRNAWADTAVPTTDIVDPGNAIVTQGWLKNTTPPPRQYFNWTLNWAAAAVRYFMQRGVVDWDAAETYQSGAVVNKSGNLCQSLQNSNTNNLPNFTGPWWGPLQGYVHTTVNTTADIANYVLTTTLTSTLAAYVTQTSLTSQLTNYVTNGSLTITLSDYLTKALASSTYLTTTLAASTYLSTTLAASVYLGITNASIIYATKAFATGTFSTSTGIGWQVLPSGVIIQWGVATGGGAPQTVTFPLAFPTRCFSITATSISVNGTINTSNPISSLTGFTLTNGAAGASTSWQAVGH